MNRRKFINFSFLTFFLYIAQVIFRPFSFSKNTSLSKTIIISHDIFQKHHLKKNHPESPRRISFIHQLLKKSGNDNLIQNTNLKVNVEKWIKTIHTQKHIKLLRKNFKIAEEASTSAVKSCIQGVDLIMSNSCTNVFCAVRPPGHHALNTGKDEGFCFYNHIAITAKYIQKKYNLEKILIIDWDYHHGNSTEYFFYEDPTVFFFSTHDANAYPGTGSPEKTGDGKGKGFNMNIHLPCGTKDKTIINVFKNELVKKANFFKPDFILISAGFDSRKDDPLGCFNLTDKGFESLTRIVMNIASTHCNGRLLSILEGGYNLQGNAKATAAHIKILNNFYL